jgi:hypothetical protein
VKLPPDQPAAPEATQSVLAALPPTQSLPADEWVNAVIQQEGQRPPSN